MILSTILANKFDKWNTPNSLKHAHYQNWHKKGSLNNPLFNRHIVFEIKRLPTKKTPDPDGSPSEFLQPLKEIIISLPQTLRGNEKTFTIFKEVSVNTGTRTRQGDHKEKKLHVRIICVCIYSKYH